MNENKYIIYKITNTINNMIYIGCHKTRDINDSYMGSGKHLKNAQNKYGMEFFKKDILEVFDTPEEMFNKESELVNEEFISRDDVYNIKIGGNGGWDHITPVHHKNSEKRKLSQPLNSAKSSKQITWLYENDSIWLEKRNSKISKSIAEFYNNGGENGFKGKTHSLESKQKIAEKNKIHQSGTRNSQFGTMWICNNKLKESKKIKKDEYTRYEELGWMIGKYKVECDICGNSISEEMLNVHKKSKRCLNNKKTTV